MISIVEKRGVAISQAKLFNGVLGISILKPLFTGEVVTEIARLGAKECKNFVVLIVDYPERWNGLLYDKNSADEAEMYAKSESQARQREYRDTLNEAGLANIELWDWYRFLGQPKYESNQEVLLDYFRKDRVFRKRLITQAVHNIGPKIAQTEKRLGRKITRVERENISRYLLEELGGLFYLFFDLGYPIDIYPGKNVWLIDDIFSNKYPELTEKLSYDWSRWGYIQVAYSESR